MAAQDGCLAYIASTGAQMSVSVRGHPDLATPSKCAFRSCEGPCTPLAISALPL